CFVMYVIFFFFQAEDGIRDFHVTGVQTCALPICNGRTVFILSCVLPSICIACLPIAITLLVVRSKATIEGSSTTTLSLCIIRVRSEERRVGKECRSRCGSWSI